MLLICVLEIECLFVFVLCFVWCCLFCLCDAVVLVVALVFVLCCLWLLCFSLVVLVSRFGLCLCLCCLKCECSIFWSFVYCFIVLCVCYLMIFMCFTNWLAIYDRCVCWLYEIVILWCWNELCLCLFILCLYIVGCVVICVCDCVLCWICDALLFWYLYYCCCTYCLIVEFWMLDNIFFWFFDCWCLYELWLSDGHVYGVFGILLICTLPSWHSFNSSALFSSFFFKSVV